MIRLQKFIADCGVSSRRKAEQLILNGEISVNGEIIKALGIKVDEKNDVVTYKNKRIVIKDKMIYVMLNKPIGYITTVTDQFGRKTVLDLLDGIETRIYPVGRLDYDTSGLLLLTNDGDLTYKLTHPKHNITKTYIAKIEGRLSDLEMDEFRKGLKIEDYVTSPAEIELVRADRTNSIVEVRIKEGKNRQVRKMFEALDHNVVSLKRIATGKVRLGNLRKGEYRYLNNEEIKYLKGQ